MSNDNFNKGPVSFEEAMAELGELVAKLEAGELSLELSIDAYKRGVELIRFCTAQLDKVEKQVQILDGELLKPFSPDSRNGADDE
ncbi:exodeoxyribonuclease VII small subunit [Oxalobacter paraformigenes]|uniref:Exodeoxyribonuclease 7 small subunit n=1 Tax=Oxalobacter paraformigenes TaxID=556268 RepID=C3X5Y0_9BURK|nr:exodeoxyribonuclease VII small subunit [Oxalobacter paraformigenes]EEO28616.1 exodeoxyribonuclease VII, small subunit [Oxalobacter paraformigenes]